MSDTARQDQTADCSRPLRLLAMDAEDLSVVSAHLQDALVRVGEIVLLRAQRRFVLMLDRFDWCAAETGRLERRRAGLHFEGVVNACCHGVKQQAPETVLNLLSISFAETDAPAGRVELTFSGGAAIRLDVECLEAQMRDMGESWPVARKPGHAVNLAEAGS